MTAVFKFNNTTLHKVICTKPVANNYKITDVPSLLAHLSWRHEFKTAQQDTV